MLFANRLSLFIMPLTLKATQRHSMHVIIQLQIHFSIQIKTSLKLQIWERFSKLYLYIV